MQAAESCGVGPARLLSIVRFAAVLWAPTWFGEIRVGGFQNWILVPMPQLPLQGSVVRWIFFVLFYSAFRAVLILCNSHN